MFYWPRTKVIILDWGRRGFPLPFLLGLQVESRLRPREGCHSASGGSLRAHPSCRWPVLGHRWHLGAVPMREESVPSGATCSLQEHLWVSRISTNRHREQRFRAEDLIWWTSELKATHSSVLAWRIPRMGEPGGLPSMGSHRVGHDWSDLAAAAAAAAEQRHWKP